MTRRKFRTKLEIPDNLPASVEELQAMVVELRAYMDKKRSQKAQSMMRWRQRKRLTKWCRYFRCKKLAVEYGLHNSDPDLNVFYCAEHAVDLRADARGQDYTFVAIELQQ